MASKVFMVACKQATFAVTAPMWNVCVACDSLLGWVVLLSESAPGVYTEQCCMSLIENLQLGGDYYGVSAATLLLTSHKVCNIAVIFITITSFKEA